MRLRRRKSSRSETSLLISQSGLRQPTRKPEEDGPRVTDSAEIYRYHVCGLCLTLLRVNCFSNPCGSGSRRILYSCFVECTQAEGPCECCRENSSRVYPIEASGYSLLVKERSITRIQRRSWKDSLVGDDSLFCLGELVEYANLVDEGGSG